MYLRRSPRKRWGNIAPLRNPPHEFQATISSLRKSRHPGIISGVSILCTTTRAIVNITILQPFLILARRIEGSLAGTLPQLRQVYTICNWTIEQLFCYFLQGYMRHLPFLYLCYPQVICPPRRDWVEIHDHVSRCRYWRYYTAFFYFRFSLRKEDD